MFGCFMCTEANNYNQNSDANACDISDGSFLLKLNTLFKLHLGVLKRWRTMVQFLRLS